MQINCLRYGRRPPQKASVSAFVARSTTSFTLNLFFISLLYIILIQDMSSHTLVVNRTPVSYSSRHSSPYHGFRNTQSTHYPRAFCHYTPVSSEYTSSAQMVVTLDGAPSLRPSVKSRKRVTPHQLKHLERVFASETHPSRGSREELARELGMCVFSSQLISFISAWFVRSCLQRPYIT